jgi:Ca2+-binding EF-hand superfamily protein
MRIIFALMDRDGDGTISLEEFQAAHEHIFKAMDTDKDGTLTLERRWRTSCTGEVKLLRSARLRGGLGINPLSA